MPDVVSAALPWITVPLGLVLIILVMVDVFLTVLHVQVESPISNRLNRGVWRLLLAICHPLPVRLRDELLGWGAPLMIAGILMFWCILSVIGFGLLYAPYIHRPDVFTFSDIPQSNQFADALYFSAISFFTIGYGDITPLHPIARLLGVLQGAAGLVTLSLSVTYLLSVYPLISRKVGLAEALNQETGGRADGVILAKRYVRTGRYEALAQRLITINDDLLRLGQAHGLYPVLYYVRHREVHHSFVRILAIVQGIVATLRYGLDPDEYAEVVEDPRLAILEEGLLATLHMLAASSHLAPQGHAPEDPETARRDHHQLTVALRQHGLAIAPATNRRSWRGHARFRTATDHYIRAYADNAGYDVSAVTAVYSRWARDTALVGHAELDANADQDTPEALGVGIGGRPAPSARRPA
ncbi:MAG: potassium channel family protein [Chloroflexota bacterium]